MRALGRTCISTEIVGSIPAPNCQGGQSQDADKGGKHKVYRAGTEGSAEIRNSGVSGSLHASLETPDEPVAFTALYPNPPPSLKRPETPDFNPELLACP